MTTLLEKMHAWHQLLITADSVPPQNKTLKELSYQDAHEYWSAAWNAAAANPDKTDIIECISSKEWLDTLYDIAESEWLHSDAFRPHAVAMRNALMDVPLNQLVYKPEWLGHCLMHTVENEPIDHAETEVLVNKFPWLTMDVWNTMHSDDWLFSVALERIESQTFDSNLPWIERFWDWPSPDDYPSMLSHQLAVDCISRNSTKWLTVLNAVMPKTMKHTYQAFDLYNINTATPPGLQFMDVGGQEAFVQWCAQSYIMPLNTTTLSHLAPTIFDDSDTNNSLR